jgi:hypothetical protein
VAQTGGHEIDVAPGTLGNVAFDVGTYGGSDTLWARLLENNGTLTPWQQFAVTAPALTMPTLGVASVLSPGGQTIALSSLVTISDPAHAGYTQLELWDSNGGESGAQFVVNGVAQSSGHEIDVAPANVANTVFDAGVTGTFDTLWARLLLSNGQATAWQSMTVATPQFATSLVSAMAAFGAQSSSIQSAAAVSTPADPLSQTLAAAHH